MHAHVQMFIHLIMQKADLSARFERLHFVASRLCSKRFCALQDKLHSLRIWYRAVDTSSTVLNDVSMGITVTLTTQSTEIISPLTHPY